MNIGTGCHHAAGSVTRRIGRDAVGVSSIGALTRLAPLVSTIVIAAYYGTGVQLDVYFLTLVVPVFLSRLVGMAITSVFVPLLVEERIENPGGFPQLFDSLFSCVALLALGATALYICLIPVAVPLLGGALEPESRRLAARMSLALSPIIFLVVVRCFLTAVFHSHRRFVLPTVAVSSTPAVMAGAVFALHDSAAIFALVVGNVVGHVAEVAVLAMGLARRRSLPRFTLRFHPGAKRIFKLAAPQVLSGAVLRLNPIVDRTMASFLAAGSISALVYAERMQSMPQQIFALGFFNVLLAHWSFAKLDAGLQAVGESLVRIQRSMIALLLPAVCFLWLFRVPLISMLLERGALGGAEANRIASVFGVYLIQLLPLMLNHVYVRVMLVIKENVFLMRVGLFNAGSNLVLNLVFVFGFGMGVEGIALSTVMTSWMIFLVFNLALKRRLKFLPFRPGTREAAAFALATLSAATGARWVWNAAGPAFGQTAALCLATVFFGAVYVFLRFAVGNQQYLEVRRLLAGR